MGCDLFRPAAAGREIYTRVNDLHTRRAAEGSYCYCRLGTLMNVLRLKSYRTEIIA